MGTEGLPHPYAHPGPRRQRAALALVAFLAGGAVLAQEILAAGWIAPLYGSGIDVWAVILAVSLLALAVGAWLGSLTVRLVDGPARILDGLVLGAATLAVGAFLVARADPADPPPLALAAMLLLGPPLALFGGLSPWIVDRWAATGVRPGRAAGMTYAVGTVGSAGGALLAGLVLVPRVGLRSSTLVVCGGLGLGAVAASLLAGAARRRALLLALGLGLVLFLATRLAPGAAPREGPFGLRLVERVDGFYGRHEVLEDDLSRYLLVDGVLQTSASLHAAGVPAPGALLAAGNALELAVWLRPSPGRALVVGLGGAAFPRRLQQAGWAVEAVEIDPVVVDLARRHFGLDLRVAIEDGRRFLNRRASTWDLIVLDVYRGEHLPGHLFTEEAFALLRARLAAGGLLAVNLIGTAAGEDVLAVVRAVHAAFDHAALFAPDDGRALAPMTLFASGDPLEHPSSRDRAAALAFAWPEGVDLDALPWEGAPRLTDDLSPLVLLRRDTARAWRLLSRRRFTLEESP